MKRNTIAVLKEGYRHLCSPDNLESALSIIRVWIIRFADYPCKILSLIYQVLDS
jgi:hypothetical protein